jgi:Spy/CpxP family protein refolding chaperone
MSDSDKKIESLLTSDQQAGYRQFEQERRDEMRSRMQ